MIYWCQICSRDRAVQPRVQAAFDDELFMCTLTVDHTVAQDHDAVDPVERGYAVRDEDDRFLREIVCQARKYPSF